MATGIATGLWEVKECASAKAKFICRQNQDTSLSPEPPAPLPTPSLSGSCPAGWKSASNLRYCYKVRPPRRLNPTFLLLESMFSSAAAFLSAQVFHSSQTEKRLSWLDAHLFCRKHDAHLLSISGADEEHFVLQVLHEAFGCVRISKTFHGIKPISPLKDQNELYSILLYSIVFYLFRLVSIHFYFSILFCLHSFLFDSIRSDSFLFILVSV